MILPFVREIFADLEQTSAFERVRRHLSLGSGRRIVSGLTATARSLYIPLIARAAQRTVIVIVADNKAAEALEPMVRAGCELTGALDPGRVVRLPAHDVLPFENLSPHPDVQEQRAAALWKLATGAVSILIAPVEAAALRLFDRDYYASLAVTLRRGEEIDVEVLTAHLAGVGYTQMDLVEMPGQFTRRGGILDIYSPESERPVRIEFFGDEIDTIRRFDPETQRSQSGLDEAQLLPLTETPVTERLLAAVNARLSRQRIEMDEAGEADALAVEAAAQGGVAQVVDAWLDRLIAGTAPKEIALEISDAAERRTEPAITEKYARYIASFPANDQLARFRATLWERRPQARARDLSRPQCPMHALPRRSTAMAESSAPICVGCPTASPMRPCSNP